MKDPRNEREDHAEMMRGIRTRPVYESRPGGFAEFCAVFLQYRRHHGIAYAARIAYGIAFKGLPF